MGKSTISMAMFNSKLFVYIINHCWLVVSTPLKNMKASWDDYSQYMENHNPNVPNHQPDGLLTMTPDLLHRWLTSAGSVWRRRFWPCRRKLLHGARPRAFCPSHVPLQI